jgi:2-methylcitrate dehydratase PrpD
MNSTAGVDAAITSHVSQFIAEGDLVDIPMVVIESGKKSILDGLGSALSGSVAKNGELVRQHLDALNLGSGSSTVIACARKVAPRFAAFANGVGMHADDYDDTQLAVAAEVSMVF